MLSGSIKFRITTTPRNGSSMRAEIDVLVSISEGMQYLSTFYNKTEVSFRLFL